MNINQLKIQIPDLFLDKSINQDTFNNLLDSNVAVQERFYLLTNEVNRKYIWAELPEGVEGWSLTATMTPKYSLIGEAKQQAKGLNVFKSQPVYVVKLELVNLYKNTKEISATSTHSTKSEVAACILENLRILENYNIEELV